MSSLKLSFGYQFVAPPPPRDGAEGRAKPFLPLTLHLWQGTWKINFLSEPLVRCHVSGREDESLRSKTMTRSQLAQSGFCHLTPKQSYNVGVALHFPTR